ncbi:MULTISPECIES: HD-GYP domain-containing protein [Bacillaceae]|uniref:HD-GYP domain-containing protein n=1 Tax=Evansella alkalicola TaxID=745819 RepID=A0ABS6JV57_9BACI|nr:MULTISPECIES: HD-GYP domain-containing protein [Bacillaceae]MBU9722290.1 HD-GYP domain-containing protein [Bacillus alkalicola]
MMVNTYHLIPGCIIKDDIYKSTNSPLIRKNTVVTKEILDVLHIFMIPSVNVEATLENGSLFKPKEVKSDNEHLITQTNYRPERSTFIDQYLTSVKQYKRLFKQWQGGSKVEAYTIRSIFLPLYKHTPTKKELMQLHTLGTKADYIYFHSVAVSVYSFMLGKKLNLKNGEIIQLGLSALLADCGMAKVPFNVFEKPSPLSVEQYKEVKKHPLQGYRMLENIPGFSKAALLGVLQHHEREDGSGYPIKLKGDKIHTYAKIIAICDIYHAMISERLYCKKKSPYKVMEDLLKSHFGKIDHVILNKFLNMVVDLSIGKKVRLNNGAIGEIIFVEEIEPLRPMVKLEDENLLSLKSHPEFYIDSIV